jgi:hypothetical protein
VYRATTHGFRPVTFHERCDGRARLLVLIRAQEGGWLFGGFTAVGFRCPPVGREIIADHSAFLYSLNNSLGRPEKLTSKGMGSELYFHPSYSAIFANDLFICNNADTRGDSYTNTGFAYAASASMGMHPMAQGKQKGWKAAQIVAWSV